MKRIRCITLGNGLRVTIPAYIRAVKMAKAHPDQEFKHGLCGWWPVTGRQVVREFWEGVEDRINKHLRIK